MSPTSATAMNVAANRRVMLGARERVGERGAGAEGDPMENAV